MHTQREISGPRKLGGGQRIKAIGLAQPRRYFRPRAVSLLSIIMLNPFSHGTASAQQEPPPCHRGTYLVSIDYAAKVVHCETIQDIERHLTDAGQNVNNDRKALEQKSRKELPEYLASLDEWTKMDATGRLETLKRAKDLLFAIALAKLEIFAQTQVADTHQELQTLWDQFRNTPLDSTEFRALLNSQAQGAKAIRQWKSYDEFVSTMDHVQAALTVADDAEEHQYVSAALTFFGAASGVPQLGVLAADVDFAGTAIGNAPTSYVAKTRVQQILQLEDAELKAISSLSQQMRRDVDKKNMYQGALNKARGQAH